MSNRQLHTRASYFPLAHYIKPGGVLASKEGYTHVVQANATPHGAFNCAYIFTTDEEHVDYCKCTLLYIEPCMCISCISGDADRVHTFMYTSTKTSFMFNIHEQELTTLIDTFDVLGGDE
jgi:hypothetical protein